jgi:hypothetical protein
MVAMNGGTRGGFSNPPWVSLESGASRLASNPLAVSWSCVSRKLSATHTKPVAQAGANSAVCLGLSPVSPCCSRLMRS